MERFGLIANRYLNNPVLPDLLGRGEAEFAGLREVVERRISAFKPLLIIIIIGKMQHPISFVKLKTKRNRLRGGKWNAWANEALCALDKPAKSCSISKCSRDLNCQTRPTMVGWETLKFSPQPAKRAKGKAK
jgi:hypothetical protein